MGQLTAGMESSEFEEFIDYLTTSIKVDMHTHMHTLAHGT